jgi:cyclopropane fatty-acyl-phospholipid synthase-like methyltransferase
MNTGIKLHLGCGYVRKEGYINVDMDSRCKPDVAVNLANQVWPWPDNSVTEVVAHHLFEHLGDPDFFKFLAELYRVCADGALVFVVVPHHNHDCFKNDPTHRRPITIEGMRLFSQAYNRHCIEVGDGASKLGFAYDVDFDIVDFKYVFDSMYEPYLAILQEEKDPQVKAEKERAIQTMIRERNNVVLETWFTWQAVKGQS